MIYRSLAFLRRISVECMISTKAVFIRLSCWFRFAIWTAVQKEKPVQAPRNPPGERDVEVERTTMAAPRTVAFASQGVTVPKPFKLSKSNRPASASRMARDCLTFGERLAKMATKV